MMLRWAFWMISHIGTGSPGQNIALWRFSLPKYSVGMVVVKSSAGNDHNDTVGFPSNTFIYEPNARGRMA